MEIPQLLVTERKLIVFSGSSSIDLDSTPSEA